MSGLENKIIKFLADFQGREFYAQEIARKLRISKASAGNILKALSEKKIVFKKTKGHMKFYQINQKSPELKKIRINLALEKISPLIPKLKKHSQKIILFGSASRGEQTFGSDMDLFVLTGKKAEVREVFKKTGKKLALKPIIKTVPEWSEMEAKEQEFYNEILSGITLYDHVANFIC